MTIQVVCYILGWKSGSLNLLNSTDVFIYFSEVRLPAYFQKQGARSGIGCGQGAGKEPKGQVGFPAPGCVPQLQVMHPCGTRLSSLVHLFC